MATETGIYNIALGKLGGAGDSETGTAFIASIDGDDKVSQWGKLLFPRIRRTVITDLATSEAPFRSTIRFAGLGSAVADDSLPEIGSWKYAFNLPGDCLAVVSQFSEGSISTRDQRAYSDPGGNVHYQWETIANEAGDGLLFLTDNLSNTDSDSAFIEYVIDTPSTDGFSESMVDCIATLLASESAPIVGRDMEASQTMRAMYENVVLPKAKKVNVSGFNNSARYISNYRGGRSKTIGSL